MVWLAAVRRILFCGVIACIGAASQAAVDVALTPSKSSSARPSLPLGLPPLPRAVETAQPLAKVELGKQLFFDARLSQDKSTSCASCHDPKQGWSNGKRFATGVGGHVGARSAPSVVNSVYVSRYFWDGRANSLEEVIPQPIQHPDEMALSMDDAAQRVNEVRGYRLQFQQVFGVDATRENLAEAIAAFIRTLVAGNSPFDRYRAGDLSALSPAARSGHDVFMFRANCQMCHRGALLSDGGFHNLGVGTDEAKPDPGRAAVTGDKSYDTGAFRTPSLRDVSRTAPYMHDGRLETLGDVLDFYEHAGDVNSHRMQMLNILVLTDEEKHDLAVFLKEGLTSDDYPAVDPPKLPE